MKVLVACANGSGTSLMLSMTVKKAMKTLGLKITNIHHTSTAEGKSSATMYDIVFTSPTFEHLFKNAADKGVHVIAIQNVMSEKEVIEGLKKANLA